MNDLHHQKSTTMKPQKEFLYNVILSLVFASVMLSSSTIFADMEHFQNLIMPLIAMLFAPLFLVYSSEIH